MPNEPMEILCNSFLSTQKPLFQTKKVIIFCSQSVHSFLYPPMCVKDVINMLEDLLYKDIPKEPHVYDTQDYLNTIRPQIGKMSMIVVHNFVKNVEMHIFVNKRQWCSLTSSYKKLYTLPMSSFFQIFLLEPFNIIVGNFDIMIILNVHMFMA